MSDELKPEAEPPGVSRAGGDLPPDVPEVVLVKKRPAPVPKPGFFEAVAWCVAFLVVQLVALSAITGLVFCFHILRANHPQQFLADQLEQYVEANKETPPNDEHHQQPAELSEALAFGMLAAQIASLGLILLVFPWRIGRTWKRQLAVRAPSVLHVVLLLMLMPGFLILSSGFTQLLQKVLVEVFNEKLTDPTASIIAMFKSFPPLLTFLAIGLGPGLVEELWCRGFIGRGLSARYGLPLGVAMTSVMFGLLHGSLTYAIPTAIMGAYLHFIYLSSRSIWLSVLLHTLNNSIGVFLMLRGNGDNLDAPDASLPLMYFASFVLVLSASVALWTSRPRIVLPEGSTTDGTLTKKWKPEYPGISLPPKAGIRKRAEADLWAEVEDPGVPPPPKDETSLRLGRPNRIALLFAILAFVDLIFMLTW